MKVRDRKTNTELLANDYPGWAPRFWHGMRAGVWWRLLARNHFKVSPSRFHIALGVSTFCPINDLFAMVQRGFYQQKIETCRIEKPPVFILGHWRSGTTLLHELLVSNPGYVSPNTYQCLAPSHFLVSPFVAKYGGFLLPRKRPMDNMAAGWLLPQEDEFALLNLGVPSPYLRIAFPKTQPEYLEYLDFSGIDEPSLNRWKERFLWFLKALTLYYDGKRLVLKSPPHTGRILTLLGMFPDAKFIHLVRNPRQLFPSTMRLWRSLGYVQSLQVEDDQQALKLYVVNCMKRMYAGFEAGRGLIPDQQIVEIKYEELVAQPLLTVKKIYDHLSLGDFSKVSSLLEPMLAGHTSYQTNKHPADPQWEKEVMEYCREYAERFGY